MTIRLRYEPWGAWARLEEPPALVALDREGVLALGLEGGDVWSRDEKVHVSMPLEVHVAVTSKCAAGCEGCYLDAKPDGEHVARADLVASLDAITRAGVFTVAFGGGEPTTRDDIGEIATAARERGLTPVLTTSGLGLSAAKVERLRDFAQVNVSYDGTREAYESVRGFDGSDQAERAITMLARAGIKVGVNVVLTKDSFPVLPDTIRRAREVGASEAQLLRYKPQGRAKNLDYLTRRLTLAQRLAFANNLRELASEHSPTGFRIRIDCALVPFLSPDPEIYDHPERLVQMGVFGCEAGGALAATRVDGKVLPCSFAEPSDLAAVDLEEGYGRDEALNRYRNFSKTAPEPCASCAIRAVCKGGCKIVSAFEGHFGPDPECPRVHAHRTEKK